MNPDQNHLKDLDRCADIKYQNISGRQHPKADSVINRAHRDATDRGFYLVGSTTRVDQVPHESNGNMAVVWAQATFRSVIEQGEFVFEGCADADPSNTTAGSTANALVRMAHTRALGRALSLALNIDEAMAEEIAENGGAPAQQQSSGGGSAPAGNSNAGGGNVPAWKFTIPMGRNKDKRIDDPTVDVTDLQWFIDNNKLNMKNPQTQQYDLPDQQRIDLFLAEIAKRSGQAPAANAPAQQQNNSAPASNNGGNWKPSPANIASIVGLGNAQGKTYAALKEMCLSNFGKPDPTALTQDEFTALSIMLGGEPV